jgi:hypothetical protein
MNGNGSRQKVVGTREVERYTTERWEYVASIPEDRAIVKLQF